MLKANDQVLAKSLLASYEMANWMDKSEKFTKDKVLVLMPINAKFSISVSYEREELR